MFGVIRNVFATGLIPTEVNQKMTNGFNSLEIGLSMLRNIVKGWVSKSLASSI